MFNQLKTAIRNKSLSVFRTVVTVDLTSSAIRKVIYNKKTKTLEVIFVKGTVYDYASVEKSVFFDLLNSESQGAFFVKNIRNNYEFVKLSK